MFARLFQARGKPFDRCLGIGEQLPRTRHGEACRTANTLTVYSRVVGNKRTPMPWLKLNAGAPCES
jgi:hypothetical protein